jgi:hypothetical protein
MSAALALDLTCPECAHPWRKGAEVEVHPEPGDVTLCNGCGAVLRFRRSLLGGSLRLDRLSELDERRLRKAVGDKLRDLDR